MSAQLITIEVDAATGVSALWLCPAHAIAACVLAHGAGAGMHHRSMSAVAEGLAELGIATLRYQFPYMERSSKRTDPPGVCHATVRAAVQRAQQLAPSLPLFAGGRSFGGRMTSQAQALSPLPHVRGLVFFAFPLHPDGKPGVGRAEHLASVNVPMLFLQGTDDALGQMQLLEPVIAQIGDRATLYRLQDADHSFHVPAKSGRKDAEVLADALAAMVSWIRRILE